MELPNDSFTEIYRSSSGGNQRKLAGKCSAPVEEKKCAPSPGAAGGSLYANVLTLISRVSPAESRSTGFRCLCEIRSS